MLKIIILALVAAFRSRQQLALENLALRHQLEVLQRTTQRPRLMTTDRMLWVWLSKSLGDWKHHLTIVQPETVIRWHREGFRLYWRWKSRRRNPGRPRTDAEIRLLIRRMAKTPRGAHENPRLRASRDAHSAARSPHVTTTRAG